MIEINYNVNDFDLKINKNSLLGKKILSLIKKSSEQENVVKIKFNSAKAFNSENINYIPNVNIIELGKKFNTPIDLSKYLKLKEIIIGDSFNSNIIWSDSIEKIIFSVYSIFNQKINNYPKKLKYLEFGTKFNQEVNNLPSSIKYLKFGCEFNNLINNLPNGLEYLFLSSKFKQDLNFLPESLITLELETTSLSESLNNLPNNLQELSLPYYYKYNLDNLPNNIKYLKLSVLPEITKLPDKIEKLEIKLNFITKLKDIKNFQNIKELIINDFNIDANIIDFLLKINNDFTNIKKINIYSYKYTDANIFKNNIHKINDIYKMSKNKDSSKNIFIFSKINKY